jgi:hypothetical protein
MAICHHKPRPHKGEYADRWHVTLYYRGSHQYIGYAASYEQAIQMERDAKRNFPAEVRRFAEARTPGYRREVIR